MTNGFALNHDKSLKIYFFWVHRQAKNDFLKDVESTVCHLSAKSQYPASILYKSIAVRYRPVSYPVGPISARYRFIKNAYWVTPLKYIRSYWLFALRWQVVRLLSTGCSPFKIQPFFQPSSNKKRNPCNIFATSKSTKIWWPTNKNIYSILNDVNE